MAHRTAAVNGQAAEMVRLWTADAGPVEDPLLALQKLAGRALAVEETIGRIVNDLTSIRYGSEHGGEQLRAEVAVLERAMDRVGRLLVDMAKLNIDERVEERLKRITEWQAVQLGEVVRRVLERLDLTPGQQAMISTVVPEEMRRVGAEHE
jgi:hypothetical protein